MSKEDANDNGELIEADESSAMGCRTDLGNVEGRDIGAEADGAAAENAKEDEGGKGPGPAREYRGDGEQYCGGHQNAAAAIAVRERSRSERAEEASDERATVGPADSCCGGEVEIDLVELPRASDDHPVVAKEQPPQSRNQRDAPDVEATLGRDRGGRGVGGKCGSVHRYLFWNRSRSMAPE